MYNDSGGVHTALDALREQPVTSDADDSGSIGITGRGDARKVIDRAVASAVNGRGAGWSCGGGGNRQVRPAHGPGEQDGRVWRVLRAVGVEIGRPPTALWPWVLIIRELVCRFPLVGEQAHDATRTVLRPLDPASGPAAPPGSGADAALARMHLYRGRVRRARPGFANDASHAGVGRRRAWALTRPYVWPGIRRVTASPRTSRRHSDGPRDRLTGS